MCVGQRNIAWWGRFEMNKMHFPFLCPINFVGLAQSAEAEDGGVASHV